MTEAEKLGQLFLRDGWAKTNDEAKQKKQAVEDAQQATVRELKLKQLDRLAVDLQFLVRAKSFIDQWKLIREKVKEIGEVLK